jgi:glucosamine 6-phosphate synthetase-like amidotransferase/phosphosugar isomerase protein
MCGIVYIKRTDGKPANGQLFAQYERQKTRGQSGFGAIAIRDKIETYRSEEEKTIKGMLQKLDDTEILFHHRFPTSTPNIIESTHPIHVSNKLLGYDYYVIHNGVITNDEELKKKHEKIGFEYTTEVQTKLITKKTQYFYEKQFNDSEALAIELALTIDGKKQDIETRGAVAMITLQTTKQGQPIALFFGRNMGNPLYAERDKKFFALSSEGSGSLLTSDRLYRYDYATEAITETLKRIGNYYTSYNYSSWSNYDKDKSYHQKSMGFIERDYSDDGYGGYGGYGGSSKGKTPSIYDSEEYWALIEEYDAGKELLRNSTTTGDRHYYEKELKKIETKMRVLEKNFKP